LAEFFDTCGGCLSGEEYYKKYPVFMTWTLVGRWMYNLNQMIHAYIEGTNKKE